MRTEAHRIKLVLPIIRLDTNRAQRLANRRVGPCQHLVFVVAQRKNDFRPLPNKCVLTPRPTKNFSGDECNRTSL